MTMIGSPAVWSTPPHICRMSAGVASLCLPIHFHLWDTWAFSNLFSTVRVLDKWLKLCRMTWASSCRLFRLTFNSSAVGLGMSVCVCAHTGRHVISSSIHTIMAHGGFLPTILALLSFWDFFARHNYHPVSLTAAGFVQVWAECDAFM